MLRCVMMVAGEASGDLHGAGVVRELRKRVPQLEVFGIGGDRMREEGMELLYHVNSVSYMGFVEVLKHIPFLWTVERTLEESLVKRRPEVVVLIDYPGFNLRFGRKAKRHKTKLLYYISPQVWAWNKGRIRKIGKVVDRMNVVFPFEVDIYRHEGVSVEFVGHPLAEVLSTESSKAEFFRRWGFDEERKLVALLPGSRVQEINHILPTMLASARELTRTLGVHVGIGLASTINRDLVRRLLGPDDSVTLVEGDTYGLMKHADAAIVTSGTATLETGWFRTPMVIVYRTSSVTFLLGRLLINVPFIGMVNIVAGKRVVPEYLQAEMTVPNLVAAVSRILLDREYAGLMGKELAVIREKLGRPGASARVAENIIALGAGA